MSPDEFYGARRDLRLHGLRGRPQPLDGSSLHSSESGMMRDFTGTPRYDWLVGDSRAYEHYMRTGVDTRFWQGNYAGYESATAAESHCMTGRTSHTLMNTSTIYYSVLCIHFYSYFSPHHIDRLILHIYCNVVHVYSPSLSTLVLPPIYFSISIIVT